MERIIQVGTLSAFCAEVPAPGPVRLNMTEQAGSSNGRLPIPYKDIELSLQGVNAQGEIVWLMWSYRLQFPDQEFMNSKGHAVYRLMPDLLARVETWLAGHGYTVLSGRYALPRNVTTMRGYFECVRFVREGEGYRLEAGDEAPKPRMEEP